MNIKIGVVAALALAGTCAFAPAGLAAVCGTGPLIEYDTNTFAYQTLYNEATFTAAAGSQLTVVGHIVQFCSPIAPTEDASAPGREYTLVLSNLTNVAATSVIPSGSDTIYLTNYGSGTFAIYRDDGPVTAAPVEGTPMPPNPPNATVPSTFQDGNPILTGTLSNFRTRITRSSAGQLTHRLDSNFQFTGGSDFPLVSGVGPGIFNSTWCPKGPGGNGSCQLAAGYSAQPNGKMEVPSTPTSKNTWGSIKILYH